MSNGRRRRPQPRTAERAPESRPVDIWRPVPPLADPPPIEPASDPTALLRSLGDPPLPGVAVVAGHYISAVTVRAAALATALAASAGLLAQHEQD
ncbi:MAG: hypothetical protein AB7Q42_04755 [Acidimicrobiia bacterium]